MDNYVTLASDFGKHIEHWNGMDFTLKARLPNGLRLQGGVSTGRTAPTTASFGRPCSENPQSSRFCHVDTNFLTQVKVLGAYTVPKIDVQLAATFQSLPGPNILANYIAPTRRCSRRSAVRCPAAPPTSRSTCIEPGTIYGDRMNQVDLRMGKLFRFGQDARAGELRHLTTCSTPTRC